MTVLHVAARAGFNQVVRILLDRGADIGSVTSTGKTALDLATQSGRDSTVEILNRYR